MLQDGAGVGGGGVEEAPVPVVRDSKWDAEWRRLVKAMLTYEQVRCCGGELGKGGKEERAGGGGGGLRGVVGSSGEGLVRAMLTCEQVRR